MGLIWDLIQHGQIADQKRHAQTLEQRFGEDLDGDNRVG
jgi:hypothetical protein